MSVAELRGWIEVGEIETDDEGGRVVVPWAELVSFAMDFWSQEVVEEALGREVAAAIRSCCGSSTSRCGFRGCRW